MEKVNKLSPKLQEIVNKARPKPGQTVYFESLRPQAGGTTLLGIDTIYDPFVENGDGSKGAYAVIAYTIGPPLPATSSLPERHNIHKVQFRKSLGNIIGISGSNRGEDILFQYLFLSNLNLNNRDKPWYAPTDGQQPVFKQQIPEMASEDKNKFRRKVRMAGEKIDDMPDSKLLDFALSLDMVGINEFSKMEEIRDRLFQIAEKNPDKVMSMDKDVNLNMKLFIKEALKYGLWVENHALKLFVWPETQEPVFLMTPGQDLYQETIKYLLGNGQDTYSLVKGLIEKKKAKDKGKSSDDGTVSGAIAKAKASSDKAPNKKFVPKFEEVPEE